MREEVYDKLHPILEQIVDITCEHVENTESDELVISERFNIDMVMEQLEDYGKYKGMLHCE